MTRHVLKYGQLICQASAVPVKDWDLEYALALTFTFRQLRDWRVCPRCVEAMYSNSGGR